MPEKKITLTAEEFKAITDRINRLEKGIVTVRPKKVTEHIAWLKIYNGQPVIGWDNVKDDGTIDGRNLKINLHLLDETSVEVSYKEFVQRTPKVMVKILKTETKERTETEYGKGGGGVFNRVDPKTDRITSDEVELSVGYIENKMEIEIVEGELTGKKLEINANYLNAV